MKKLVIDNCSDCPYFDNHYYSYNGICRATGVKIDRYIIPEDCPLEDTDEPKTDL
jgi:hypothetical protein